MSWNNNMWCMPCYVLTIRYVAIYWYTGQLSFIYISIVLTTSVLILYNEDITRVMFYYAKSNYDIDINHRIESRVWPGGSDSQGNVIIANCWLVYFAWYMIWHFTTYHSLLLKCTVSFHAFLVVLQWVFFSLSALVGLLAQTSTLSTLWQYIPESYYWGCICILKQNTYIIVHNDHTNSTRVNTPVEYNVYHKQIILNVLRKLDQPGSVCKSDD